MPRSASLKAVLSVNITSLECHNSFVNSRRFLRIVLLFDQFFGLSLLLNGVQRLFSSSFRLLKRPILRRQMFELGLKIQNLYIVSPPDIRFMHRWRVRGRCLISGL